MYGGSVRFSSYFLVPRYLLPTLIAIWLAICATSRCLSLGSQTLAPSTCPQVIRSSSSSKDFSTTSEFLSHRRTDEGQRQSAALLNVLEILFSRRMMARKVLLQYVYIYISIWSFYPVAKYCKAPFPRNVQHPHPVFRYIRCQHLWQKQPASERYPCRVVSSYSGSALQTKGSWVSYRESCRICKD